MRKKITECSKISEELQVKQSKPADSAKLDVVGIIKEEKIKCVRNAEEFQMLKEAQPYKAEADGHQITMDSTLASNVKADFLLDWLLSPIQHKEFFEDYWEENPVVIHRKSPNYFGGWFTSEELKKATQQQILHAVDDVELFRFSHQGKFESLFVDTGKSQETIDHENLWNKINNDGYSLSFRSAVKFSDPLWRLLSTLEEAFGTRLGCWATMSPPGAQARPPHTHNYHSLIMQLEGQRRWHIWPPTDEILEDEDAKPSSNSQITSPTGPPVVVQELPREPVDMVPATQLPSPLLEVDLDPGDVLYLPCGFVHKARTVGHNNSLHLSLSFGHENSYADFLEMIVPEALEALIQESADVRRALPRDYLNYTGAMHMDNPDAARVAFKATLKGYLQRIMDDAESMIDAAADQFGKRFVSDKLPPPLTEEEEDKTTDRTQLGPDSLLKLVTKSVCRLVVEEGKVVLYHAMDNGRAHHEAEMSPLEFELDDAPAIEALIKAYPGFIKLRDLPHPPTEDIDDKMGIAEAIFNEGLLICVNSFGDNEEYMKIVEQDKSQQQRRDNCDDENMPSLESIVDCS